MAPRMVSSSFTFPSLQHSYFSSAVHGGSKRSSKAYYPANMNSANVMGHGGSLRVHEAQHFRASLRMSHPPMMYLDDSILSSGLEEFEGQEQEQEQAAQSLTTQPEPRLPRARDQGPHGVPESNDGTISPLELPPRLVNFDTADRAESTLLKLDLKELDHRLQTVARTESIFRLERLLKANMLDDFFACLGGMRI